MFSAPVAFGADDMQDLIIKNADIFENNYQSFKQSNYTDLSPTEKMFNTKESVVSGNILFQQGYNFNTMAGTNSSATGKYGKDYKLGLGEKLNVYSYGDSVNVMAMSGSNLLIPAAKTEVGSNGSIYISGIGPVRAENRTLGEVENEVNKIYQLLR